jgi:hypothetical protein
VSVAEVELDGPGSDEEGGVGDPTVLKSFTMRGSGERGERREYGRHRTGGRDELALAGRLPKW